MRVFDTLSEINTDKNTVLTLGTFDGIHLGHQKIIEIIKKNASFYGGKSFNNDPLEVFRRRKTENLSTLKEKIVILETWHDNLLCHLHMVFSVTVKEF
jgi:riboflavin kinase/FMN adenylyltransferase